MGKQISIIMGAYNCEKTLAESLDSILNQTYSDFLCYVCDDGSSDGTTSLIKAYAEKDSRIVFLKNDRNCGLAVTLNRLIAFCHTPYIARMDGDDIAEPDRLEKQINFLESHPEYDLCGSAVRYFDETGFWGEHIYPEQPERKDFLFVNPFAHPTIMFRTSSLLKMTVLEKINDVDKNTVIYSEDPKTGRSEDYELFMRMYAKGMKGYNFQEPLLRYRENRAAYTKRKFKYTFAEARVRFIGFKKLNLLPKGLIYVIKPVIIGLIPPKMRLKLRKRYYK